MIIIRSPILLFLLFSFHVFAQDPEVLTLQYAIQIALQHNRAVQSAQLEVEKSSDRISATRTHLLPAISFSVLASRPVSPFSFTFDKGIFGTFPDIGPVPAENTDITTESIWTTYIVGSVQQPLTQLYEIKLNEALLKSVREENKEKEREERQNIVNQVKKVYYAILQYQSSLRYADEEIKLFEELKRVTDGYVIQKAALKSEGMEVKARLANAGYNRMLALNQVTSQMEQLNILLGRDLRTKFTASPVLEPAEFENDLEAGQNVALQQRPELKQAQSKVKQAELDARIKRSEFIPDLSLSFNYISPRGVELLPTHIATYGFYLTWDVFDWGKKSHELAEKKRSIEQARLALTDLENRVLADVNLQHRKLQESRLLVEVIKLNEEAAQEKVRTTTNRYKQQSALLKDVLQAQTSLEEQRDLSEKALLSLWVARADFEKAMGVEP